MLKAEREEITLLKENRAQSMSLGEKVTRLSLILYVGSLVSRTEAFLVAFKSESPCCTKVSPIVVQSISSLHTNCFFLL